MTNIQLAAYIIIGFMLFFVLAILVHINEDFNANIKKQQIQTAVDSIIIETYRMGFEDANNVSYNTLLSMKVDLNLPDSLNNNLYESQKYSQMKAEYFDSFFKRVENPSKIDSLIKLAIGEESKGSIKPP